MSSSSSPSTSASPATTTRAIRGRTMELTFPGDPAAIPNEHAFVTSVIKRLSKRLGYDLSERVEGYSLRAGSIILTLLLSDESAATDAQTASAASSVCVNDASTGGGELCSNANASNGGSSSGAGAGVVVGVVVAVVVVAAVLVLVARARRSRPDTDLEARYELAPTQSADKASRDLPPAYAAKGDNYFHTATAVPPPYHAAADSQA